MKNNKDILDEFGKLVATVAFDSQYGSLLQVLSGEGKKFERLRPYSMVMDRFDSEEKKLLKEYFFTLLSGTLFDFLKIFEENQEFKIVYQDRDKQINLVEISEMLKAEPIIENGWIDRYSDELKDDKIV